MTNKRSDGRGAFLGTEDIVRRLRQAQGSTLAGVPVRAGAAALLVVVVAVGGALGLHRLRAGRHAKVVVIETTTANAAEVSSLAPPVGGPAAAASPAGRAPSGSDGGVSAAVATHLSVRVLGATGTVTLLVDNVPLGTASHWEGALPRGRHVLTVRHGRQQQEHTVLLQNAAQEVVIDLRAHRVHARNLHGARKGH